MTQRTLAVLVVLNAVLLAAIALTFTGTTQPAQAQIGGGSYLMIAGENDARPQQQVIYIFDTRAGRVGAIVIEDATGRVDPVGSRELAEDLKGGGGRR